MAEYLIIDGYNIINAWQTFKNTINHDLEHARNKLIDIMADYQAVKGVNVIIVFDAHLVKGGMGSKEQIHGVNVIYTAEGETADAVIEKITGEFNEKDRVVVATSDWAQQRIVFGRGGIRLSARELERDVTSCQTEVRDQIENKPLNDLKLKGQLNEHVREIFEKMRRQR